MKITESQLRKIIREEAISIKNKRSLKEAYASPLAAEELQQACVAFVENLLANDPSADLPGAIEAMKAEVEFAGTMMLDGKLYADIPGSSY